MLASAEAMSPRKATQLGLARGQSLPQASAAFALGHPDSWPQSPGQPAPGSQAASITAILRLTGHNTSRQL